MEQFKAMSESELEIMNVLWNAEKELSALNILAQCQENHPWKRQTVTTFLFRLAEKGLVQQKKQGRDVFYVPKITFQEYESNRAKSILDGFYQGSVKNFMSALCEKHNLSKSELEELKHWISEQE